MTTTIKKLRVVIREYSLGANISIMLLVALVAIAGLVQLSETNRANGELREALALLGEVDRFSMESGRPITPMQCGIMGIGTIFAALLGIFLSIGSTLVARSDIERQRQVHSETERLVRTREEELRAALARSSQSESARLDFLAILSHELRTPLNTILGYTHLLLEEPAPPWTRKEYLEAVRSGGDALRGVIHEILDFAAIERGAIKVLLEPVDMRQLLRNALSAMRPPDRRDRLVEHIDDSLPSRIWADESKLRQIIVNLVSNALKFTPQGGVTVRCGLDEDGQLLAIEVIDNGIGMAEADIPRFFEPFSQAESSMRRRFGGVGLGLAICKGFVEAMGGSIAVKSQQGKGSHFSVRLPLRPVSGGEIDPVEIPPLPVALTSLRCLVVDDSQVNRKLMVALLARLGITARSASTGEECLSMISDTSCDIIFMDLEMPEMDGFDTTLEIRRMESSRGSSPVAIVALTGDVLDGVRERCAQAGMNAFLGKPVRPSDLITVLSTARAG